MARVKMEEIVDHLSSDMKRALEATIREVYPNAQIDRSQLYRSFRKNVRRKCGTWENVPDSYVEK